MSLALQPLRWRIAGSTRSYAAKSRPSPRNSLLKPVGKPKPNIVQKYDRKHSETLTLPDSRTLGFSSYGPTNAPALLFCHGFPGSRLDAVGMANDKMGIRLIGIDRPGMGLSTFQKNRSLLDHPQDVLQLVDYLGIQRFRVLGGSAGGPYALACAKAIPKDRLKAVGVMAGYAPVGAGLARMSNKEKLLLETPALLKLYTWWTVGSRINHRSPTVRQKFLDKMAKDMGLDGQDVSAFSQILAEPWRQGVSGYVEEAVVLQKPWGFDLGDVDSKDIRLWYGEKDNNTPVEMGRYMSERLKGSTLKTYANDDHFSLWANHGGQIIEELMAAGQ